MGKRREYTGIAIFLALFFCFGSVAQAAQTFRGQGIQISYPDGWAVREFSDQVNLFRSKTEWVQIDMDSPEAFASRSSVDLRQSDAMDRMTKTLKRYFKRLELHESQRINTPGRQGYFYLFTAEDQGNSSKQAIMDFVENGKVYSLQFVASPEVFDQNWGEVKAIFDSVEVVQ
jgi:hypothetical protein